MMCKETDIPRGLGHYKNKKIEREHRLLYDSCDIYVKNVITEIYNYAHHLDLIKTYWADPCIGDKNISELCAICPYKSKV